MRSWAEAGPLNAQTQSSNKPSNNQTCNRSQPCEPDSGAVQQPVHYSGSCMTHHQE